MSSHACVDVNPSCKDFTKEQSIKPHYSNQSTESPILMPLFGQKTGFRARNAGMNEIKSGIPCSDSNASPCHLMRVLL